MIKIARDVYIALLGAYTVLDFKYSHTYRLLFLTYTADVTVSIEECVLCEGTLFYKTKLCLINHLVLLFSTLQKNSQNSFFIKTES